MAKKKSISNKRDRDFPIEGISNITEHKRAEEALQDSERKYRTLIENLPQKIFLKTKNSVYVSCNKSYAHDLKISPDDIFGKTDFDFYPEELAEKYRADDKRIIESKKTEELEERYIQDGKECYVYTVKTPVEDENGNIIGVLGIFWDITERKRTEEELKKSEEFRKQIIESSNDCIKVLDLEGRLLFMSQGGQQLMGIKDITSYLNKSYIDFWKGEDNKAAREAISKAARGGCGSFEGFCTTSEGTPKWWDVKITPIRAADGKVEKLLSISRDITERKKAQEDLRLQAEVIHNMADGVILTRVSDGIIVYTNPKFEEMFGYGPADLIGKNISVVNVPSDKSPEEVSEEIKKCLGERGVWQGEVYSIKKDGTPFWCYSNVSTFNHHAYGNVWVAVYTNITDRKAYDELRKRERELEIKTRNLKEVNTALNVLLKKREEDKTELEDKVLLNIKKLVNPYVEKLRKSGLDETQGVYLDILESNLNDIVSSFSLRLSVRHLNFTPLETQIANLIKQGKMSKEIAELLHCSVKTIDFHRDNIRRKLGLRNQKTNLKSYLSTIT